jgi:ribonucleotide monophosphatase NagD (HAD superfamily)
VDSEGAGSLLIATNPDAFHPGLGGSKVLETGALVASVEAIIGKPIQYVGKPAPHLFHFGMRLYGVKAEQCVMVGDNLYTDIAGGIHAGMRTVWIRGAGMNQSLAEREHPGAMPDIIVNSMEELVTYYNNNK